MSIADEIEKLNILKSNGAISEEEFQEAKRKLLQHEPSAGEMFNKAVGAVDEKMWSALIHLALILGYAIPVLGLVVPIVLWQIKKNDSPFIDANGKIVANWILSALIFFAILIPFCFILVGIPLLHLLGLCNVVFAIIGAIKAYNGELWPYPIAFKFFH